MNEEVDVTIVGNGAVACAIAFVLASDQPDARVAIVGPKTRPGSASLAAAAMLNAFAEVEPGSLGNAAARRKHEASIAAAKLWDAHLARLGADLAVERGTYVLSHAEVDPRFDAMIAALREYGEPFREVDPSSIARPRSPARRAVYLENEGAVPSAALHAAYDDAFARMANVVVVDDEVVSVDAAKTSMLRSGGAISSKVVVLAAGASTQALVDGLGLGEKIPRLSFGCGVAIVVESRSALATKVVRTSDPVVFTVPYGPRCCYVGSTYHLETCAAPLPRAGDVAHLMSEAIDRVNAELYGAEVKRVLTGYRPVTADGYPLVGKTSIDGIWLATGTKRDGFHLSPLIARELVSSLPSGAQPFDGAFRPERPAE